MFTTFEETKHWIENIKRFGSKLDLHRISSVLALMGRPHLRFRTIHVAGTNGKGSTASYIKSILMQAGYKVGLYTSPYIVKFNERIAINDVYISDDDIVRYANQIKPLWDEFNEMGETITFFEVITAICFLYFRDQKVDYGVIEVGLGGTLDATNVIRPQVSVITNISFDHMNVLGNTLESIAKNKLGIVKDNVPLVTSVSQEELLPLFEETVKTHHTTMTRIDCTKVTDRVVNEQTSFTYEGNHYVLNLPGFHQIKNAVLAIEAIKALAKRRNLTITEEMIQKGLFETKWPGRLEIFDHHIVLDGAHNIGGALALKDAMMAIFPDKKIKCLVSIMHDKEHAKIIDVLDSFCDELYFTQFDYERRADANDLFLESHHQNKKVYLDYQLAFEELRHLQENEILLMTGSLYFISEVRKLLVK